MFVTKCNGFTVYQFVWQVINSNTFVVCDKNTCLIVDPIDSEEFYQFLQERFGLSDKKRTESKEHAELIDKAEAEVLVLLTHSHYDHISGLNKLRQLLPNLCVIASKACSENIQNPKKNLSNIAEALISFQSKIDNRMGGVNDITANAIVTKKIILEPFACGPADKTFENELQLKWQGHTLQLTEYRGHSKDSVCCIMDGKYLFSGDTLLPIPAVTRLPGGSPAKFWEEDMPNLEKLAGKIVHVFPGHEMPGRLEDMLAVNVRP